TSQYRPGPYGGAPSQFGGQQPQFGGTFTSSSTSNYNGQQVNQFSTSSSSSSNNKNLMLTSYGPAAGAGLHSQHNMTAGGPNNNFMGGYAHPASQQHPASVMQSPAPPKSSFNFRQGQQGGITGMNSNPPAPGAGPQVAPPRTPVR
ncbi:unnamed protein product, partial [Amoebophrya sp. A25]